MLARTLRQTTTRMAQGARMASTKHSSVNGKGSLEPIYQTFFKNNVTYVTSIVAAAIVIESVYGSLTSYVWESSNRGRLYEHVDWSKFKSADDDEEEEEEDDE